jgi:hypothetical protein
MPREERDVSSDTRRKPVATPRQNHLVVGAPSFSPYPDRFPHDPGPPASASRF